MGDWTPAVGDRVERVSGPFAGRVARVEGVEAHGSGSVTLRYTGEGGWTSLLPLAEAPRLLRPARAKGCDGGCYERRERCGCAVRLGGIAIDWHATPPLALNIADSAKLRLPSEADPQSLVDALAGIL